MLARRLQRRTTISQSLGQHLVFAGWEATQEIRRTVPDADPMYFQFWASVAKKCWMRRNFILKRNEKVQIVSNTSPTHPQLNTD